MKENMVKSASVLTMTQITIKTYVAFRGGQAKKSFFKVRKLLIRKFLGSFRYRKFAISYVWQSTIRKSANFYQILHNSVTLSQNRTKSRLCKRLYEQIWIRVRYLKKKKHVFSDLRNFLSPEIAQKISPANLKSAKCHICGRSANLTNYLSLQVYGLEVLWNLFADSLPLPKMAISIIVLYM